MDAENAFSGSWSRKKAPADSALAPADCAVLEEPVLADAIEEPASGAQEGHDKFGVEEHALYDFRDYGLD